MTTINAPQTGSAKRKHHSLKIDMTPMVDLGFLLITFFIFTAALSQPGTMRLIMPADGNSTPVPQSKTITLLLDKDKAYSYEGLWEEALAQNKIHAADYNLGLRTAIRQKQTKLSSKDDLIVLIKPIATASYQNVIAALDEMTINNVKKYALVNATEQEQAFLQKR